VYLRCREMEGSSVKRGEYARTSGAPKEKIFSGYRTGKHIPRGGKRKVSSQYDKPIVVVVRTERVTECTKWRWKLLAQLWGKKKE